VTRDRGEGKQLRSGRTAVARILIVEDEPRIAGLIARALESCGYDVESVGDGLPALEKLEAGPYHVVLLDLLLPGFDGFSFLQRLSERGSSPEVLVLSALSDVESKVRCFELGASDYMTKPFSIAELLVRIRARLRDSRDRVAGRFLEDGTFKLDLQRHAVVSGGKRVDLSTREFLLLEYLMRKEGEVCTREELLSSVWGYTFDPHTNVVDVYISRLRGKLGTDVIETIRNVGYCYAVAA
jgi:two-component system copper resistance phosphate regulon response regulator CusR